MERIPMTPEGFAKMKEELTRLKTVDRAKNIQDIETAREHGDLSENAEYHAAKEKQSIIAALITELEDKVSRAEVINPKDVKVRDRVVFGATVKLYDLVTEEELHLKVVGDSESDIKHSKIGISSPIARGILGKREGDAVRVQTPKGVREFEIVSIEYV